MKFQKKINNSVAWVMADNGEELIAIGKGISFGKVKNDVIDEADVERIFKANELDDMHKKGLYQAIESIQSDIILLTEEICGMITKELKLSKFDDSHFIALADHLNFALKQSEGSRVDYPENLRWEVQKLYQKEYDIAIDILYFIEKKTGVRLPKSEQTFLTYHIVNAQYDGEINIRSMELAQLINRAIEIIQYHYQMRLDQNSVNYIRFVTHLRHFILRQLHGENEGNPKIDAQLVEVVQKNYRKAYLAAEKVGKMIESTQQCGVSNDELFYLTLHIDRVTDRQS